jgi:hypothetical protein
VRFRRSEVEQALEQWRVGPDAGGGVSPTDSGHPTHGLSPRFHRPNRTEAEMPARQRGFARGAARTGPLSGAGTAASDQVALRMTFHPRARTFGKSTSTAFNAPCTLNVDPGWATRYACADAYRIDDHTTTSRTTSSWSTSPCGCGQTTSHTIRTPSLAPPFAGSTAKHRRTSSRPPSQAGRLRFSQQQVRCPRRGTESTQLARRSWYRLSLRCLKTNPQRRYMRPSRFGRTGLERRHLGFPPMKAWTYLELHA